MNNKHYLTECSEEELKKMILYPSELWGEIYEIVAEDNGYYATEVINQVLGKDYHEWTKYNGCSYDWWLTLKPGCYAETLEITDLDYFSEADQKTIKELQTKVRILKNKVENLDGDAEDYYDKIAEWEDEADELANKILQIVVKEVKGLEEVTDEQCLEIFLVNDMGGNYYYLGDDKETIYKDITKSYKVKGQ